MAKQEKEISRLAKKLPMPTNTIIKGNILHNKSRLWQAHLQRIPDYLTHGPGHWWNWTDDSSVEFYDGPEAEETKECGPSLHHFRSTSIKSIQNKLDVTWKDVYTSTPEVLPVQKLRNEEGKLIYHNDTTIDGNYYKLYSAIQTCFQTYNLINVQVMTYFVNYFELDCMHNAVFLII
jgi:hypothetical protein